MQWIKTHLTVVICASLALVSVALGVLGVFVSDTTEALAKDANLLNSVQSAGRNPVNANTIEEERKYQAETARQVADFMANAVKASSHTPLCADVFPKPARGDAPVEFKRAFRKRQQDLMDLLHAKDQPSQQERQAYADQLASQKAKREREQGGASQKTPTGRTADAQPNLLKQRSLIDAQRSLASRAQVQDMTPEERVREDPDAACAVIRARELYCYATIYDLQPHADVTEVSMPGVEAMWNAQVSMWIEEDVLGALAKLNDQAAETLPEKDRWVGSLPVKQLVYFSVGGYVPRASSAMEAGGSVRGYSATPVSSGGMAGAGPPPGIAEEVFTQQGSTDNVDVVQFAVGLVVEARMLLKVIDVINHAGFYTPLRVSYKAEQMNPTLTDYVYGSNPVINVRLEYEVSMLRSKYGQWMPESVKNPAARMPGSDIRERGGPAPSRGRGGGFDDSRMRGGRDS